MSKAGITRKDFLQGALASIGLGFLGAGRRVFAVPPGWTPGGAAKLTFGVISDTHVRVDYGHAGQVVPLIRCWRTYTDVRFKNALGYFQSQSVDAVMHCGDWADKGQLEELKLHKDAWNAVFTDPDCQPKKLFVTGNHDHFDVTWMKEYWEHWDTADDAYRSHLIRTWLQDATKNPDGTLVESENDKWSEIWGEPYSDVWYKVVNGYHFFGCNFLDEGEADQTYIGVGGGTVAFPQFQNKKYTKYALNGLRMAEKIKEVQDEQEHNGKKLGVTTPVFIMMHYIPHEDVSAAITSALGLQNGEKYCKGLMFRGHGHISNSRWNSIEWPKDLCVPCIQCGSIGEKGWGGEGDSPQFAMGFGDGRAEGSENSDACHGLLVKVYDDCIVIRRLDLYCDTGNYYCVTGDYAQPQPPDHGKGHNQPDKGGVQPIGPDWVIKFDEITNAAGTVAASHPFLEAGLLKYIDKPEFPSGATLQTRIEEDAVVLDIPKADGNTNPDGTIRSRVYGYNVEVVGQGGAFRTSAYANGYNFGCGYEPDGGVTNVRIPKSSLPPGGNLTFRVWPCSMLGTRGEPIFTRIQCIRVNLEKTVPDVKRPHRFVITSGANLQNTTCVVADKLPWVRCVCVEDGEIVVYTRTSGGAVLRLE